MRRLAAVSLCTGALAAMLSPVGANASVVSANNFSTAGEAVVCGVAEGVEGTQLDPGTGAPLKGFWPGLQCQAAGIPRVHGIGDPAVQLGQGRAGRARLLDISQDDLASDAPFVSLAAGSVWKRDGIACTVEAASVRCTNKPGYGFTLSPGHVHLFAPAAAQPKGCGSVSYTFPHTGGHGHAALNNLAAVGVSCLVARSLAHDFLVIGRPPRGWHAAFRESDGQEVFTRGTARVSGQIAN